MYGCNTLAEAVYGGGCAVYVLPPPRHPARPTRKLTLGCGTYDVVVLGRGGRGPLVANVPWSSLEWGRVVNDTSTATVTCAQLDPACCAALGVVRPWRHELAVYRDGDRVWDGPIVTLAGDPGGIQISARDVSAWWDHRFLHSDHAAASDVADLAALFEALVGDAMGPDPSPGIALRVDKTGVDGTIDVKAAQYPVAGQQLREIAGTVVDWTALLHQVLVAGLAGKATPVLRDDHFSPAPRTLLDGTAQANRQVVSGGGSGVDGEAFAGDARDGLAVRDDGLLETAESLSTVTDLAAAQAAADGRLLLGSEVVLVENAVLSQDAPVTIDDLVPGSLFRISLERACPTVDGTYRLSAVNVRASADDPSTESVSIVLEPRGAAAGARGLPKTSTRGRDLLRALDSRLAKLERGGAVKGRVSLSDYVRLGGLDVTVQGDGPAKQLVFRNPLNGQSFVISL